MNKDSIIYSSLKSFASSFFMILGFGLAFLIVLALFLTIDGKSDSDPSIDYQYTPEIIANGEGIRKVLSKTAPVILKIDISGVIGTEFLNKQTIEQQLIESQEQSLKDGRVKALILTINSPGGTVTDADGIYRLIKAYKEKHKLPVFAFVDGLCASGGVYISCAADKIFATDTSIIGSVGVLIPTFVNVSGLMEKIGVQSMTLSAGKGKDDLNPLRPWKEGEQQNLQSLINYYYEGFVDIVTSNRKAMDRNKLINEYGAKVFPSKVAKDYGYIDETNSSFDQVLSLLAKEIGIEDHYYQVIQFKSKNWLSNLLNGSFPVKIKKGSSPKVQHELHLPGQIDSELMNQWLYLYRP